MASMLALVAALSFLVSFSSAFRPLAKTNVAVYWGQGPYQERLIETCKNPSVDIINIGFVNVFPDEGPGGYPGTNFGNACEAGVYKHNGKNTDLLKNCEYIGPDITACQKQYGKKVLLSLGGAYPPDYYIANNKSAVHFAKFLWGAFGPQTDAWTSANKPRPFGDAVIDGFDFDIESQTSPAPQHKGVTINDYQTRGYAKMIETFKNVLFNTDTSKRYFISGAPQCVIPDVHFANLVSSAWFDFLFVQFYNTPYCSARAGVNNINGDKSTDISFPRWTQIKFFNPKTRVYIGLPANTNASNEADNYLNPTDANKLIRRFYQNGKFGGVMLWEATYAMNNVICGKDYATWIKHILKAAVNKKSISTTCATPNTSFASINATSDAKYAAVKHFKEVPISKRFVPVHSINGKRQITFSNTSSVASSTATSSSTFLSSSLTDITSSSSAAINATAPSNGAPQATTTSSSSDSAITDAPVMSSAGALPGSSASAPASNNATFTESPTALSSSLSTAGNTTTTGSSIAASSSFSAFGNATSTESTTALSSSFSAFGNASSTESTTALSNSSSAAVLSTTSAIAGNSTSSGNQATALAQATSNLLPGFANSTVPASPTSSFTSSRYMNMTSSTPASESANITPQVSQKAAALTSAAASETTETVTIYSTRYLTITQELNTQTITTVFPIATTTVVVTGSQIPSSSGSATADAAATDSMESATPTSSLTAMTDITITKTITVYATQAVTTCAPGVSGCSSLPASQTVVSTMTKVVSVYTTLIVTQAPVGAVASATPSGASASDANAASAEGASLTGDASTVTELRTKTNYQTQYYTTIIDVLQASSSSLYNPHSDEDTTTTTTTTLSSTSTVYQTITVSSVRPTVRSTMTVTNYVTVSPVSTLPADPNPTQDTHVYSPQQQAQQAAQAAAAQSSSAAAAAASSMSVVYSAAGAQETAAPGSGEQMPQSGANGGSNSGVNSGMNSGSSSGSSPYSNSTKPANSQVPGAAQGTGFPHIVSAATGTATSLSDAVAATPYPTANNNTASRVGEYQAFATMPAFKIAAVMNSGNNVKFDATLASVAVAVLVLLVDGLFL
ncbi:hypothetical protein MBLNU457_g2406t1 [Dothideomycetes sp. NU457]